MPMAYIYGSSKDDKDGVNNAFSFIGAVGFSGTQGELR